MNQPTETQLVLEASYAQHGPADNETPTYAWYPDVPNDMPRSRRAYLNEFVIDQDLPGSLSNMLNRDSTAQLGFYDLVGNENHPGIGQWLTSDVLEYLQRFGVDIESFARAVQQFLDTMNNPMYIREERRDDFRMSYDDYCRLFYGFMHSPDTYGTEWGIVQIEEKTQERGMNLFLSEIGADVVGDFDQVETLLKDVALEQAERAIRAEVTVDNVVFALGDKANLLTTIVGDLPRDTNWNDLATVLNAVEFNGKDDVVAVEVNGYRFEISGQNKNKLFGIASGGLKMIVTEHRAARARDMYEHMRDQFNNQGYMFEMPGADESFSDDEVLDADSKNVLVARAGKFLPKRREQGEKGGALVMLPDETVITMMAGRIEVLEVEYVDAEFFSNLARSPYPRLVPTGLNGVVPVALSPEQAKEKGIDFENPGEGYSVMVGQRLLLPLTGVDVALINEKIDYALEHNEELVIFVPTCPTDTHALNEDGEISFTSGAIVPDAVSWTCLNTTDAIAPLVRKLAEIPGLRTRVVYATGDMEYTSGNTRNMSEGEFTRALDQNNGEIAKLVASRLGEGEILQEDYLGDGVRGRRVQNLLGGQVEVDVNGIMRIAETNGFNWNYLKESIVRLVEKYFDNPDNSPRIAAIGAARTKYYTMRVALAENIPSEEAAERITPNLIARELRIDILDYVAFHMMAKEVWGERRMLVLAGDSYPLEHLAADIVENLLLGVAGNYDGSAIKEAA